MISTRGRYALRVLIDLSEHMDQGLIPMKVIAQRQQISHKYLESIMPLLIKDGLLEAVSGKNGGYRLNRSPDEYKIGHILRLTEGNMAPVSCLSCDAPECNRKEHCKTLPMWQKYQEISNEFFDKISIQDLLDGKLHT